MSGRTFLLLLCLCVDVIAQDELGVIEVKSGTTISGKVVDAVTKKPLGNTFIVETEKNDTAAFYYTHTNKDGNFSFTLQGTGHILKVLGDGYKSATLPIRDTTYTIELYKMTNGIEKEKVMYQLLGPRLSGDSILVIRLELGK